MRFKEYNELFLPPSRDASLCVHSRGKVSISTVKSRKKSRRERTFEAPPSRSETWLSERRRAISICATFVQLRPYEGRVAGELFKHYYMHNNTFLWSYNIKKEAEKLQWTKNSVRAKWILNNIPLSLTFHHLNNIFFPRPVSSAEKHYCFCSRSFTFLLSIVAEEGFSFARCSTGLDVRLRIISRDYLAIA